MIALAFRRHAHRLHRWVGLVVGVQVVLWMAGGLLMSALPIERVRGEHKVAEREAVLFDPDGLMPLSEAMRRHEMAGLVSAQLVEVAGRPVWRIEDGAGAHLMDARTGAVLPPLDEAQVRRVAAADYAGPGEVASVVLLEEPPTEYGRPGPVWRVTFDDADRTALYVAPDTGEVRARRGRTWRVFDLAWRLHVMDWDDGADFNHPLLVTTAGAGTLLALSGTALVLLRLMRRRPVRR